MPTKPKKYPYTILRDDNTYLTYDMTRKEYEELFDALLEGKPYYKVETGIVSLKDIRHVVEYIEPEEPETTASEAPVSPEEMEIYKEYLRTMEDEEDGEWFN